MLDFGHCIIGEAKTKIVEIYNNRDNSLKVAVKPAVSRYFQYVNSKQIHQHSKMHLEIVLRKEVSSGIIEEKIEFVDGTTVLFATTLKVVMSEVKIITSPQIIDFGFISL